MPRPSATRSPASSWSVASISTLSLTVSSGGPAKRGALVGPSPPVIRAVSVRVSVAGLYWKTTTVPVGLNGDTVASAPLNTGGATWLVAISACLSYTQDTSAEATGVAVFGADGPPVGTCSNRP